MTSTLFFERISETAQTPTKAHDKDGGWDVFADEEYSLKPFERKVIKTGLRFQLPQSSDTDDFVWILDIRPKSGRASKEGLMIVNSPGLLDEEYRGELMVICYNSDPSRSINIFGGQKLAQVVLSKSYKATLSEAIVTTDTSRGTGGFGSTGL